MRSSSLDIKFEEFKMAAIRGVSLKQVARIRVSFCPYDSTTSTARCVRKDIAVKKSEACKVCDGARGEGV